MKKMRTIAGKKPGKIKVGVWRDLNGYDPLQDGNFDYTGLVERIAKIYGVTVEDVESELSVDELLPLWIDCVNYVNGQVFAGLDAIPKNGAAGKAE